MAKELITDSNYKSWIKSLKENIYSAQIKASIAVNEEMLRLYWNLGKDICDNQFESNYGSKFFETLSRDLKSAFPDVQGFSVSNLKYMKRFYLFYKEIRHQLGDEFENQIFVIPWRHHIEIFTKAKSKEEALFFVQKTKENGWSRAMLVNMMDTRLYETKGNTVNNFSLTLPKEDSECARQILRDTYKLDFLTLRENYEEKDLHKALEQNLTKFLLELGKGFAFVGSHVSFVVNGDEYECDLLFYNLKLRRYIVVELKIVKFQPEFVSKLNFYCNAVNHLIKDDIDKDTIGLLICKEKNDLVAQWTVEKSQEPICVSTYELTNIIPQAKDILPDTTEIENSLNAK
jgi:predicted nuclease of restriction endonuclease-like (RecB) superfamily